MSYEYDVFVSYCRRPPVSDWVDNHFLQLLEQWLGETELGDAPRVFIDRTIETGSAWPQTLRNALLRSRLLVPVFGPGYFRSKWCMAELHSMLARERVCTLRTDDSPRGLIVPVRFSNGVPDDFRHLQYRDLQPYNYSQPSFAQTAEYLKLVDEIKLLSREIVANLELVPEWQREWPVELPVVNTSFRVPQPRL